MPDASNPVTPEDVIPDGVEGADFNGTFVRKGSVGAFIANAKILDGLQPGSAEYEAVAGQIRGLKPALETAGVFDVFEVRNPAIAEILDR